MVDELAALRDMGGHQLGNPDSEVDVGTVGDVLRGALRAPWVTLGIGFALFAVSLQLLPRLGTELVPQLDQGEFYFEVTMPEGSSLQATVSWRSESRHCGRPTMNLYSPSSSCVAGTLPKSSPLPSPPAASLAAAFKRSRPTLSPPRALKSIP